MPPELGAFLLGYLLIMASPGPNMVAIGTIAALEGLGSALPMIAGIACGVGGLAIFMLAVSELPQVEALSPALQFLPGLMLLTVAWAISRKRNFAPAERTARTRRNGQGLALFLAGFSTAASNPITIAYFAAVLVPIGRANVAESGSSLAIVLAVTGAAVLFWFGCAVLMARPAMRGFVRKREGQIRTVAATLIAVVALPMLLTALGVLPGSILPGLGLASLPAVKP
ncbi:MAG: LysE family transporter [Methylobacterium sp.]|nr:LysE family transporter [Methylobacterium sp.]MCA3615121.1 LysE family transporter [Methylobacterium sp.]MCA3643279.1 LysE family transporter [Methylobacterium sp.]MCA4909693.1 LysE family transporter [Methylobacterium sp.]